jgi:hypothetical protein
MNRETLTSVTVSVNLTKEPGLRTTTSGCFGTSVFAAAIAEALKRLKATSFLIKFIRFSLLKPN